MQSPLCSLDKWYSTVFGKNVLQFEKRQLDSILNRIHGDFLIQIGGDSQLNHSKESPIFKHTYLADDFLQSPASHSLMAMPNELPFLPKSIDLILLVHVLELSRSPILLLKDIEKVLTPAGHVIIVGFNPYSAWGVSQLYKNKSQFPWNTHFWPRKSLQYWLISLNFQIKFSKTFGFSWPHQLLKSQDSIVVRFREIMGQLLCPSLGNIYIIVAKKQVYEPIKQRSRWWVNQTIAREGVIESPS